MCVCVYARARVCLPLHESSSLSDGAFIHPPIAPPPPHPPTHPRERRHALLVGRRRVRPVPAAPTPAALARKRAHVPRGDKWGTSACPPLVPRSSPARPPLVSPAAAPVIAVLLLCCQELVHQ